ncbi:MAG: hypothetical protein AB9897_07825 [Anaerolineaceae bacterium]
MSKVYESRESSSPIITRAVAAGLAGKYSQAYEFDPITKILLKIVGAFPQSLAQWLIPRANKSSSFSREQVRKLNINDLIKQRLSDYSALKGPFPAITMGVGMGGTTAHLALGLGGPFLPQAFVLTLQNGSMDGDVDYYFNLSAETAQIVTKQNPGIMSIQHYDPIHDGWLVRRVNHLRLKLLELPELYQEYIHRNLIPGGELVYLEGGAKWKQYKVGENNVFQVGGWGDISAEEFLNGSERIKKYCDKEGITKQDWKLKNYPLIDGAESEWGSEPGLRESLKAFCEREGYQFTCISFDDPNQFNQLGYQAVLKQLEMEGRQPAGVVVEVFSQYDATSIIKTGLVPLWLIFNTDDSVRFLKKMVPQFPVGKPVFFSPLSTFSLTPDLASWESWNDALNGIPWINIGTRSSHYPADTNALVDWQKPLDDWCKNNENQIHTRMTSEILQQLAKTITSVD